VPKHHLLHVFPTFALGGPQIRFARLAEHFGSRFRHTVLALNGDYSCCNRVDGSVDLEIARSPLASSRHLPNLWAVRRWIARIRPDLMITYNWGAVEWALANRGYPLCRHIHQEDGFGPDEAVGQLARRILLRRLALSGRHSIVIVPSQTLMRIAVAVWGLAERQIRLIPNGVNLERFPPPAARLHPAGIDRDIVVGTVAKLRAEKNIGRLIRAFAAVDRSGRSRLLIVGDGAELERLRRTAVACGVESRVEFAGASASPERMLAQMDVFAISSDTEQMPLSVLEAMACGLPVAGLDVGDVSAMVSHENRPFIVGRHDEVAFRAALQRLMRNPEARRRLGAANRAAAVERFDEARMFAAYAELLG
jgi:glycosyltransferase involved in cell wall biosynthesis